MELQEIRSVGVDSGNNTTGGGGGGGGRGGGGAGGGGGEGGEVGVGGDIAVLRGNDASCKLYNFAEHLCYLMSSWLVLCLTIERFAPSYSGLFSLKVSTIRKLI